ncbi:RsmB/NOP family class I SAM-dependent RNA methyltransferase [Poritiphilus flavus]|uniref:Methyltransferase domain-containing protein n=1 Tax=Poritiphilus flavus TaxID=2697053 RepID=A0A6L9EAS3_9FLAO|nr:RsmB/NOP family class I SAM-dependent RNA methyltransferase [Poritiphilus flavus]NAS11658.1 methyltransferase domain-containing protein [Poritiphilus flavus]
MRLHKNLVFATISALEDIFNQGQLADKTVERVLKQDKRWGSRDRGFIAETTYDIVRWKRLYAKIAGVRPPYSREDLFRVFAVWAVLRGISLPDWKQFSGTPVRRIKGKFDELSRIRKYRESIPDWLDSLGAKTLGEELWTAEIAALNQQAEVILRVNTLKTTRSELQQLLAADKLETETIKGYPNALRLKKRANVFASPTFKAGLFEVQDAASQLVAPFLQISPGDFVIDACAGAGGKSLHLAALMENKGQLLALDIYPGKLKELKRRARRNGVHNTETRHIDSQKVIKKLTQRADKLLLDVPCTGTGVLRRNPDAKWKLQPEFLDRVIQTQKTILRDYSKMVKKGGTMVYATCSILRQENSDQVQEFLQSDAGEEFSLEEEQSIFASEAGFDGFYMARLKRK